MHAPRSAPRLGRLSTGSAEGTSPHEKEPSETSRSWTRSTPSHRRPLTSKPTSGEGCCTRRSRASPCVPTRLADAVQLGPSELAREAAQHLDAHGKAGAALCPGSGYAQFSSPRWDAARSLWCSTMVLQGAEWEVYDYGTGSPRRLRWPRILACLLASRRGGSVSAAVPPGRSTSRAPARPIPWRKPLR